MYVPYINFSGFTIQSALENSTVRCQKCSYAKSAFPLAVPSRQSMSFGIYKTTNLEFVRDHIIEYSFSDLSLIRQIFCC